VLGRDPPDHTRLRALVNLAFTPRLVEQLRPRVQALADRLLDWVEGRGHMELIRRYALPLPTTVIAELLGVPARDRHRFHRWLYAIGLATVSAWGVALAVPNVWLLTRYLRRVIRQRRADRRDDLISALSRAEAAGDRLSAGEVTAMVFLLLVAGFETTVNLIGSGTLALLEHPGQLARLRADPALIRPAVEELLRYTSPVEWASDRYTREAVTFAGVTIPRGQAVFAVLASANRDERQFPDPDALDLGREPNRHLAFGLGTHFCLGAALARLEGQIALGTLLRRFPDLRLAVPPRELRWRPGLVLRGLEALPVAFGTDGPRGRA
jgi:cytochrome P450 PksS